MRFLPFIFCVFLSSCSSIPVDLEAYYEQTPTKGVVIFESEYNPEVFMRNGHEYIFVCKVDGVDVQTKDFRLPVSISKGLHIVTICYHEGLNRARTQFEYDFTDDMVYSLRLGEHSWTKVNFWIEEKVSKKQFVKLTTVPVDPVTIFQILPIVLPISIY